MAILTPEQYKRKRKAVDEINQRGGTSAETAKSDAQKISDAISGGSSSSSKSTSSTPAKVISSRVIYDESGRIPQQRIDTYSDGRITYTNLITNKTEQYTSPVPINASQVSLPDKNIKSYSEQTSFSQPRSIYDRSGNKVLETTSRTNYQLAQNILSGGTFQTEAERIKAQALVTGQRATFSEALVQSYIEKFGEKEGRKKALELGISELGNVAPIYAPIVPIKKQESNLPKRQLSYLGDSPTAQKISIQPVDLFGEKISSQYTVRSVLPDIKQTTFKERLLLSGSQIKETAKETFRLFAKNPLSQLKEVGLGFITPIKEFGKDIYTTGKASLKLLPYSQKLISPFRQTEIPKEILTKEEEKSILKVSAVGVLSLTQAGLPAKALQVGIGGLAIASAVLNPTAKQIGESSFYLATPLIFKKISQFKSSRLEPKLNTIKIKQTITPKSINSKTQTTRIGSYISKGGKKIFFEENIIIGKSGKGTFSINLRNRAGKILSSTKGTIKRELDIITGGKAIDLQTLLRGKGTKLPEPIKDNFAKFQSKTTLFIKDKKPIVDIQKGTIDVFSFLKSSKSEQFNILKSFDSKVLTGKNFNLFKTTEVSLGSKSDRGLTEFGKSFNQIFVKRGKLPFKEYELPIIKSKIGTVGNVGKRIILTSAQPLTGIVGSFQPSFGNFKGTLFESTTPLVTNKSPVGLISRQLTSLIGKVSPTISNKVINLLPSFPKSKFISKPDTIFSAETQFFSRIEEKAVSKIDTEFISPINESLSSPIESYKFDSITSTLPISKVNTVSASNYISDLLADTTTKPSTVLPIDNIFTTPKNPTRITPEFNAPLITTLPQIDFPFTRTLQRQVPSFDSFAKEKGKLIKLNKKALTENQAINLLVDVVDRSSSASGKIQERKNKIAPSPFDYLDPEIIKFNRKGNTFTEKNKYRIDTAQEKRQITAKGILAQKEKRLKNLFI